MLLDWIVGSYFVYARCQNDRTLASNMAEAGLNFPGKGSVDFQRVEKEDVSIYQFPAVPKRLGWNGLAGE